MHWIWFIIVGAIVGILGRLIHPGRDPMGFLLTIAIGVISMIIAAAISGGWLAFIIGVIIAVILVALAGRFVGEGRTAAGRV
jgi:uncharacterized membrane protein YeaQ/YmgE (transglycosylase-associated protein family)